MSHAARLHEALVRHSRFVKDIARRHDYAPLLTLIIRDAQGTHPTVVHSEDHELGAILVALADALSAPKEAP